MTKKLTLEQEINDFLKLWSEKEMMPFLADIIELVELYDVEEEDDWVLDEVEREEVDHVRLIRTVYLMAKIAEKYSPRLSTLAMHHRGLYRKIERQAEKIERAKVETLKKELTDVAVQ